MATKRVSGLFSADVRAAKAALVYALMLLAVAGCVDPAPRPPSGGAGGPDICALKFAGNCYEQGGGGHDPPDAGIAGSDAGSGGGDGGGAPAGAGGSPAGSGGASGDGGKASAGACGGQGAASPNGEECHAGSGGQAGSGSSGQGGADQGGASGNGGTAGQGGQGGEAAGAGGASEAGKAGSGGTGQGSSSAGASGAFASGAGGAGQAGAGAAAGGPSGNGGQAGSEAAGAGGAGADGASGNGGNAGTGSAGSSGAGEGGSAGSSGSGGQAALKPWGCKDFVVDTGFEDQQPTDQFDRYYQSLSVAGPYVFGGNSWGVDVLTKKGGAWQKVHVPDSGSGVEWAAGPDKDGYFWFAASGALGNQGLFKGKGETWSLVADAPPTGAFFRLAFAPDGTLYATAYDGQSRIWKRTPAGQWTDLVGNHPMKDMGVGGLAFVGGTLYASLSEAVWKDGGSVYVAAHLYAREAGKWAEIPGVSSKAVVLDGLASSGDHGLVASGAKASPEPNVYLSTALFIDLPSMAVTVADAKGFGYGRTVYSPRFGSYLSATQLAHGDEEGVAVVQDGFGLTALKPFAYTTNSVGFSFSDGSSQAVFFQPVGGSNKATFATATCGEL